MKTLFIATTLLLALQAAQAAQAEPVWRCGADGRNYSDAPCPAGRKLDAVAPRPADDVQAAHAVAANEARLARRAARQRALDEAAAQRHSLAGLRTTPPGTAPDIKPKQRRLEDAGTWPATRHASRRAAG